MHVTSCAYMCLCLKVRKRILEFAYLCAYGVFVWMYNDTYDILSLIKTYSRLQSSAATKELMTKRIELENEVHIPTEIE